MPWPLLAVGYGVFGFGLVAIGDISLSYAMDCYEDVSAFWPRRKRKAGDQSVRLTTLDLPSRYYLCYTGMALANHSLDYRQRAGRRRIYTKCDFGGGFIRPNPMDQWNGLAKSSYPHIHALFFHYADTCSAVEMGQKSQG